MVLALGGVIGGVVGTVVTIGPGFRYAIHLYNQLPPSAKQQIWAYIDSSYCRVGIERIMKCFIIPPDQTEIELEELINQATRTVETAKSYVESIKTSREKIAHELDDIRKKRAAAERGYDDLKQVGKHPNDVVVTKLSKLKRVEETLKIFLKRDNEALQAAKHRLEIAENTLWKVSHDSVDMLESEIEDAPDCLSITPRERKSSANVSPSEAMARDRMSPGLGSRTDSNNNLVTSIIARFKTNEEREAAIHVYSALLSKASEAEKLCKKDLSELGEELKTPDITPKAANIAPSAGYSEPFKSTGGEEHDQHPKRSATYQLPNLQSSTNIDEEKALEQMIFNLEQGLTSTREPSSQDDLGIIHSLYLNNPELSLRDRNEVVMSNADEVPHLYWNGLGAIGDALGPPGMEQVPNSTRTSATDCCSDDSVSMMSSSTPVVIRDLEAGNGLPGLSVNLDNQAIAIASLQRSDSSNSSEAGVQVTSTNSVYNFFHLIWRGDAIWEGGEWSPHSQDGHANV